MISARKGFVQIIIVAAIALLIGAVGILGYQKYFKKSPASVQETETTNSSSQIADETANWKTYEDDKLKISIKYPSEVQIRRTFSEGGVEFGIGKSANPNYIGGDQLLVLFRGNAGEDPQTVFETTECPKKNSLPCDEETSLFKINNAIGITTLGPNYPDKYNYYLTNESKTAKVIRLSYLQANDTPPQTEIFAKMISTFKFTN